VNNLPVRKRNRLKNYDYRKNGAYFVTICVQDRREILGEIVGDPTAIAGDAPAVGATVPVARVSELPGRPCVELSELGKCIDNAIMYYNTNNNDVFFDKYVIMPNHIHMIVIIRSETGDRGRSPLQYVVRNLKSYITKQIGFSIWQKSFHDHIIRNDHEYNRIVEYIENNPQNWEQDYFFGRHKQ
jgi:REP element-mobilizing transposase RayT